MGQLDPHRQKLVDLVSSLTQVTKAVLDHCHRPLHSLWRKSLLECQADTLLIVLPDSPRDLLPVPGVLSVLPYLSSNTKSLSTRPCSFEPLKSGQSLRQRRPQPPTLFQNSRGRESRGEKKRKGQTKGRGGRMLEFLVVSWAGRNRTMPINYSSGVNAPISLCV